MAEGKSWGQPEFATLKGAGMPAPAEGTLGAMGGEDVTVKDLGTAAAVDRAGAVGEVLPTAGRIHS